MIRLSIRVQASLSLVVLSLIANFNVVARAGTGHLITLEDSETLKQANYLQLSPKGDLLAYVLEGQIWLIATDGSHAQHTLGSGTIPLWSPDGRRLAYYSNRSGTNQLWVLDLGSGKAEEATHLDGGIDPDPHTRILGFFYDPLLYSWSPDGTKLVFASQVIVSFGSGDGPDQMLGLNAAKGSDAPLVLTKNTPPEWTLRGIFSHAPTDQKWVNGQLKNQLDQSAKLSAVRVNQLFIVDLDSKEVAQLTKDQAIYFNPDWSPDGKKIVCASSEGRSLLGFGSGTTNIYAIDIATRKKSALTAGKGDKRLPRWSPHGRWIAYLGGEHFGTQCVFLIPSTGGEPLNVTSKMDRYVLGFDWSSDQKSIVVHFVNGVSWSIARVQVPIGGEQVIADEPAYRWPTTISRSGTLAWQQSDGSSMGVIRMMASGSTSVKVLLDLNPQIKEWQLGEQEVVRWRNSHGEEMEGILIRPVGYETGRKYPLIVDCYPGVQSTFFGFPMSGNQQLAARGYVIFYPNARTPYAWMNPFKGAAHDRMAVGPGGWDITVEDVLSGVDELIRRGMVDPDRMALYGFSNGGAIVNYLVTETNRFKCAISASSVLANWLNPVLLHTMDPMVPQFLRGTTPWDDPSAYIKLSAVFRLDKVTTPILLADGDDIGDLLLDSIEMYNGLRWFGRDVTLLRYPGQGHVFTGSAIKDFSKRESEFFDKYLKPETPPN